MRSVLGVLVVVVSPLTLPLLALGSCLASLLRRVGLGGTLKLEGGAEVLRSEETWRRSSLSFARERRRWRAASMRASVDLTVAVEVVAAGFFVDEGSLVGEGLRVVGLLVGVDSVGLRSLVRHRLYEGK